MTDTERTELDRMMADPRVQAKEAEIRDTPETDFDDPARGEFHRRYYAAKLDMAGPVEDRKPILTLILGIPASGKTKWLRPQIEAASPGAVVIDADEAKAALPEHGRVPAAAIHPESGEMAKELSRRVVTGRHDMIVDQTGKNVENTVAFAKKMHDIGYDIRVAHITVDPVEAARRSLNRAFEPGEEGRYVSPDYIIRQVGNRGDVAYERIKAAVPLKGAISYDNNVPKGSRPRLRERSGDWAGHAWREGP